MRVLDTEIPGALIIEPDVVRDERGFFVETSRAEWFRDLDITHDWAQDNHSRSRRGV